MKTKQTKVKNDAAKVPAEVRIAILQRGFVYVGYYERGVGEDGEYVRLTHASCIRYWKDPNGGLQGLRNGPNADTKLDPAGVVEFHRLTEIASIVCDAKTWGSVLVPGAHSCCVK